MGSRVIWVPRDHRVLKDPWVPRDRIILKNPGSLNPLTSLETHWSMEIPRSLKILGSLDILVILGVPGNSWVPNDK